METPATRSTMGDPSWVSCQLQWHDARLKRKGTKELEGRGPAKLLEGAATASPLRPTSSTSSSPVCIQGSNSSRTKDGNFCFCPPTPQISLLVKRPSPRSRPSSDERGPERGRPCKSDRSSFTHRDFPRCSGVVQALRLRLT